VPVSAQVLYNNGVAKGGAGDFGITTNPGEGFGGADVSQSAPDYGRSVGAPIFADDFTLGSFQSVISSLTVYSHIPGYGNTSSPFTSTTIDIYSGRPGDVGSSILASSSEQATSVFSNVYRVPTGSTVANLTNAERPIFATTVSFTNLTLNAGNYWFTFRQTASVAGTISVSGVTSVTGGTIQLVPEMHLALTRRQEPGIFVSSAGACAYRHQSQCSGNPDELPFLISGRAIEPPPPAVAPEPGSLLLALLPAAGNAGAPVPSPTSVAQT
jgi:hypothetical protein